MKVSERLQRLFSTLQQPSAALSDSSEVSSSSSARLPPLRSLRSLVFPFVSRFSEEGDKHEIRSTTQDRMVVGSDSEGGSACALIGGSSLRSCSCVHEV